MASCRLTPVELPSAPIGTHPAILSRYLGQVARRVLVFKAARALSVSLAVLAACLLLCAFLSGPFVGGLGAVLVWSALLSCALVLGGIALGNLSQLRGPRRARLLNLYDRGLAARVQSAAELIDRSNGSSALVAAYGEQVARELSQLPITRAAPAPLYFRATLLTAWLVTALCVALFAYNGSALSGLYALTHPARADQDGTPVGLWVASVEARVTGPRHLGLATQTLSNPAQIETPAGSRIELRIKPRFDVERAVLALSSRALPMTREANGDHTLSFTAAEGGALTLRAYVDEHWLSDSAPRKLVVISDGAPTITLDAPVADADVGASEPVPFLFRATDDHGLGSIDLVVQNGRGRERRVHLQGFEQDGTLSHEGNTYVTPSDFGARPGVALTVWLEARDRDRFDGPHVGRSVTRVLRVGGEQDPEGAPIGLMTRTRDLAVDTLGDRLERAPAEKASATKDRTDAMRGKTRNLLKTLESLTDAYGKLDRQDATGASFRDMVRRISRIDRDEREHRRSSNVTKLARLDASMVTELEDDILWLSDLIGRAKLSDASRVLERLEATRARMRQLLAELKASSDPERRRALLEEIARARGELSELSSRLSEARGDVPSEFVNYDALKAQMQDDPLSAMEKALESGDIDAAERALAQLDQQLEGLKGGLGEGQQAFADARLAPRNRALEQARAEVANLERAQKSLANETQRLAQGASDRASEDGEFRAQADALATEAERLEQRARDLGKGRSPSAVAEAQANSAQRLRDARDALKHGDAHEAQSMAERAADELGMLAGEMNMESQMFPGANGARARTAQEASELARDVAKFSQAVRDASPQGQAAELSEQESEKLRQKAPSQRSLGEQAERVAKEAEQGAGRSVGDGLGRAREAMQRAAQAMEQGESGEAQAHQRDALDRLEELNQELSREQQATGEGRSAGTGENDGESGMGDERVAIPQGGEDTRRKDLRRRVLDARRAKAPDSFSETVERYYQEILR